MFIDRATEAAHPVRGEMFPPMGTWHSCGVQSTNFSWWIVQVQPTKRARPRLPNSTNFSWWIVQVQPTQERAGDSRFVSSSLPSRREGRAR